MAGSMIEQPSKWWRKLAPVDLAAEPDNVVQMPRVKLDTLERAIKDEQSIMREIVKAGRDLEERYNECETRLTNARAALAERLKDLGLTMTETTP
jgi:hypothetical protein